MGHAGTKHEMHESDRAGIKKHNRMMPGWSLNTQILVGFVGGIIVGLLFGDSCSSMEPIVTAFVRIWQITVIPLVIVSLIKGIGSLNQSDVRDLIAKAGSVMLLFWFLGITTFFAIQLSFPNLEQASFFSTTNLQKTDINILDIFIPYNPFRSLSEGLLPAVVVFCLCLGFALIGDEDNKSFMSVVTTISRALSRINRLLMRTFPFGIFFITAVAAGTITPQSFLFLQVFLISLAVTALLLSFLALPLLVSSFTTFRYKEIITASSKTMLLGFSTGNEFITLPTIVEEIKDLFNNSKDGKTDRSYEDVLVPIGYTFPLVGSFVPILFILFTAWNYASPLDAADQLKLMIIGLPSFFGCNTIFSVEFLLGAMHLPADAFNLYLSMGILRASFAASLTCMSIFCFATIGSALLAGSYQIKPKRLIVTALFIIFIFIIAIFGLRFGFSCLLADSYHGETIISSMDMPMQADGKRLDEIIETEVYSSQEEVALDNHGSPFSKNSGIGADETGNIIIKNSTLDRIKKRGSLRVGYNVNNIPFTFFNKNGTLVGYDVEMAYDLSRFLGISKIEFIPIDGLNLINSLNSGLCDIIMSAITVNADRLNKMSFSNTYITAHMAMVVKDEEKSKFMSLRDIQKMKKLKIAVINKSAISFEAPHIFPSAIIVKLESFHDFFKKDNADALLTTAEEGSTMTLLYPFYDVAIFQPSDEFLVQYAYPVAKGDDSLLAIVNYWLQMEKESGKLDKKYDYWILGKNAEEAMPRWCIVRNILHLTD